MSRISLEYMDKRKSFILDCLKKRMTYDEIGGLIGISRQRTHQIATGYHSPAYYKLADITTLPKLALKKIPNDVNITRITGIQSGSRDRTREMVRIRDNHTCRICLRIWREGERRFDVHHLDESREGLQAEDENLEWDREHTDRMITLCHKCHLRLDHLRPKFKVKKPRKLSTGEHLTKVKRP